MLGFRIVGDGEEAVLVLHNWFADALSYESVLPYLDTERFKYAFVDLRGYGKSKHLSGDYSNDEVAKDVLELADALGWKRFHLMGHSMSGMFAQYLACVAKERIKSMILVTPVPACGSPMPKEAVQAANLASAGDDAVLESFVHFATGNRLGKYFARHHAKRFRDSSTHEARMGYRTTFSDSDFAERFKGCDLPILVIAAAHDNSAYGPEGMRSTILSWCPHVKMEICTDSGHFPMIETPGLFAAYVEKFLSAQLSS